MSARLPREKMSVFCGPSGSGKSSLALDTIYAEGQRRYVESLSSYARQFLGQVQKPKVEHITGLSPAISIEQKTTSKSPRSTVGTITEVYDYLRILYARLGERHCPQCGRAVGTQTADEIVEKVLSLPQGTKLYIMAPIERKGQEKYDTLWEEIRRAGYTRMRVDRKSFTIDEPPAIDHRRKHSVEVVVDRNVVKPGTRTRIAEAVEQSLELGRGVMHIAYVEEDVDETKWKVERFSQHLACEHCNLSFEALNPHHYSFNSPLGWCPTCEGLGVQRGANETLLLGDTRLSLRQGAVTAWPSLTGRSAWLPFAEALARHAGFDLDTPYAKLAPEHQRVITHGAGDEWIELTSSGSKSRKAVAGASDRHSRFQYKGLFPAIDEASRVSWVYRHRLDHLVDEVPCSACRGSRVRPDAAATRFNGLTLGEVTARPLGETLALFQNFKLTSSIRKIAGRSASARLPVDSSSSSTSASTISRSPDPDRRSRAARPNESASPLRSARGLRESFTSSTSRQLGFTRAITSGSCKRSGDSAISATPSSWSNTTGRSLHPPITSWISGLERATAAARSPLPDPHHRC